MKKILSFLLLISMIFTLLPLGISAAEVGDETAEAVLLADGETEYPAAKQLRGDKHIPVIGNQGAIGCCTAMSTTYMQFTNAISRLYAKYFPDINWNPSSGNRKYIFSPKFTYDASGSYQNDSYGALRTVGCTTLSEWGYAEGSEGGYYWDGNQDSMAWVNGDAMYSGIKYQQKDYESQSISAASSKADRDALILRIKENINAGNVVTVTGSSGYWQFTKLTKDGEIGKAGESCLYGSYYYSGMSAGGHAVSIVGYDDNVECVVDGKTLKGAVLMANSWGMWNEKGYTWVMYDAIADSFEGVSRSPAAAMYLTMGAGEDDSITMYPSFLTENNQNYEFKRVTTKLISYHIYFDNGVQKSDSKRYDVYTIQDKVSGKYLAYTTQGDAKLFLTDTKGQNCYWAFIPYSCIDPDTGKETGLCGWDAFTESNYDSSYDGSYWILAVNRETDNLSGNRFLDAGLGYSSSGRAVGMASLNSGAYPEAKSWFFDEYTVGSTSFTTRFGIFKGHTQIFTRGVPFYSYYFADWQTDYRIGFDEIYLEVNVTIDDRGAFYVLPSHTTSSGSWTDLENMIYEDRSYHLKFDVELPDYLTFSGVKNGAPETVTLYYRYFDCTDIVDLTSKDWGFKFGVSAGRTATVNSAKLLSGATKTELYSFLDAPVTLKSTDTSTRLYYTNVTWSTRYTCSGSDLTPLVKHQITASLPDGLKLSSYQSTAVTDGDSFVFDVIHEDGRSAKDEITALYVNGEKLARFSGVFTLNAVTQDNEITVDYTEAVYYTVSTDVDEHFTLNTTTGYSVKEGSNFIFTLTPVSADYSLQDVTVTANGAELTPSGSRYTVAINADTVIKVEYHSPFLPGDMNGDRIISIVDVTRLLVVLANEEYSPVGDLYGDGVISIRDITELLKIIAEA